jgi:magnesium transporter
MRPPPEPSVALDGDPDSEPPGVCIAIQPNEKPIRLTGSTPGEFLETLSRSNLSWVNFAVDDLARDGSRIAGLLGFSGGLVEALLAGPFRNYEDRETEFGLRLPVVRVIGHEVTTLPLLLLCRWGLILTLHESGKVRRMVRFARYADTFMRKIPQDRAMPDKLTILLTRLLNENNERNFEGLRYIQEHGDIISATMLDKTQERDKVASQVYEVKHALVQYLDSMWASLDVIHSLRYGDAELVSDDETLLARLGILGDDVTRQIQLSEHTTEVLVSGLEVLQSVYNNQLQILNNRLALVVAWLTILGTAILVPNTIATTMGPITDYAGEARTLYVVFYVAATLVSTILAFWFVRRKGLLRAGPEP